MKKVLSIVAILVAILFVCYNIGFQFGNIKIGKQFDEIEANSKYDIDNSPFSKKYLHSDSVSVINLWASWCHPCIKEMPLFTKLAADFPQINFATISIDSDSSTIIKNVDKFSLNNDITIDNRNYRKAIRNFLENRDLKSLIKTEIVPVTYIIKKGKVIYKETGTIDYKDFSKKLESLKK